VELSTCQPCQPKIRTVWLVNFWGALGPYRAGPGKDPRPAVSPAGRSRPGRTFPSPPQSPRGAAKGAGGRSARRRRTCQGITRLTITSYAMASALRTAISQPDACPPRMAVIVAMWRFRRSLGAACRCARTLVRRGCQPVFRTASKRARVPLPPRVSNRYCTPHGYFFTAARSHRDGGRFASSTIARRTSR
jgi:hypothetical protein